MRVRGARHRVHGERRAALTPFLGPINSTFDKQCT
jgi:hypothetical protein